MTWCFLCVVYCEFGFRKCCSIVLHFDSQSSISEYFSESPQNNNLRMDELSLYTTAISSTHSE